MSAMRWVGYVRLSKPRKARPGEPPTDELEEQRLGLAAQEASIRAALKVRGHVLVELVTDDGVSGRDTHRPGFQRALAMVADGTVDGLIVSKLDRATRSLLDAAQLMAWLEEQGAGFRALDMDLDTTTETGALVAHIMASVGEFERRRIGRRTREALAELKAQGHAISGPSASAALVKRLTSMRAKGMSYSAIAARLNEQGVPTVRGGAEWRASSVQSALGYRQPRKVKPFKAPKVTKGTRTRRAS